MVAVSGGAILSSQVPPLCPVTRSSLHGQFTSQLFTSLKPTENFSPQEEPSPFFKVSPDKVRPTHECSKPFDQLSRLISSLTMGMKSHHVNNFCLHSKGGVTRGVYTRAGLGILPSTGLAGVYYPV